MRSSSGHKPSHSQGLEAIDARISAAALAPSQRRKLAGHARNPRPEPRPDPRFDQAAPEELSVPAPVPRRAPNGVEWLPVPGWDFSWFWAGFSTRNGGLSRAYSAEDAPGELNLGFTAHDDRKTVIRNRRLLAEAVTGDAGTPLITLRQFHSNLIVHSLVADAARAHPRKADGQMTNEPGVLLAIQTADCVPVLVADLRQRAVAAFHAGWRGTANRIVESGIGRMRLAFGSRPRDLVAAIGPAIRVCCYAVGEEVLSAFESQFSYARELFLDVSDADPVQKKYPMLFLSQRAPGHSPSGPHLHVDLIEANRRQLLAAGLSQESIQDVGGCTQCHRELFFSHRGSRGHAGRIMGVIGIRGALKAPSHRL